MTQQQHAQDEALALATSALKLMDERAIAPTPNNFTVWYNYFSGDRPDLNRALTILLDSESDFTAERNAQIFEKYCTAPYEAVPMHLIAERMEAELATVLSVARPGRTPSRGLRPYAGNGAGRPGKADPVAGHDRGLVPPPRSDPGDAPAKPGRRAFSSKIPHLR